MMFKASKTTRRSRRVLIVVENLPARRDRRVWRECQALVSAGYGVSVISPRAPGGPAFEEIEGIRSYTYPAPPEARSKLSFVYEYFYSWLMAALLSVKVLMRDGFDAIQVCNPPDTYFLLGRLYRLFGKPFVFDHHDLAPEVYLTRFGDGNALLVHALRAMERATFRAATHVISTNESYRQVALGRGGRPPHAVTVVRNGPDLDLMQVVPSRPELRNGRSYLCCWFGNMGPQDGVHLALEAIGRIVHERGQRDCHFVFMGTGDALDDMRRRAAALDVEDWTTFTGWISDELAFAYLSTADIGLSADPPGPLNDVSTMNKTMEYMAFGLPVVAFDLKETRVSAAEAAVYAPGSDVAAYADLIVALLDAPHRRAEMGRIGRQRVERSLAWRHQRDAYVGVYDRLLARPDLILAVARDTRVPHR